MAKLTKPQQKNIPMDKPQLKHYYCSTVEAEVFSQAFTFPAVLNLMYVLVALKLQFTVVLIFLKIQSNPQSIIKTSNPTVTSNR